MERNDKGVERQARGHRTRSIIGHGRKRKRRRLHGSLLRSRWNFHTDDEAEERNIALQVSYGTGERRVAVHSRLLLLHELADVALRSLVPVQLSEQSREVRR